MGVVTRYFSTTANGSGDGTSWANRAALFNGSNQWSSVILNFDFSGSDSLVARIGPGSYTCGQTLAGATFTTTSPNGAKVLSLVACDSNGDILSPPNPTWCSAQPAWDSSNMPLITASSNVRMVDNPSTRINMISFLVPSSITHTAGLCGGGIYSWCIFENNRSATGTLGLTSTNTPSFINCVVKMTGTSFSYAANIANANSIYQNVRIECNKSASSGNRDAILRSGNSMAVLERVTVYGSVTNGINHTTNGTAAQLWLRNCVFYGCDASGARIGSTTIQTLMANIDGCIFVNNGTYGLEAVNERVLVLNSRFRNNGTADRSATNIDLLYCETGAGTDADEFVNAAGGDLRIKNTSDLWGRNIGAGDEPEDPPPPSSTPVTRAYPI